MCIPAPGSEIVTLGLGCRKGKPEEEIEEAVFSLLQRNHLSIHSVKQVSSIDLKKEEPGILAFCQKYQLPFVTYSAEELLQVKGEFSHPNL